MKQVEHVFNILFIVAPVVGFIPQIVTKKIIFPEILSVISIISNILKLFHYRSNDFSSIIALQGVFIICLHLYLVYNNMSKYSDVEERILRLIRTKNNINTKYVYLGIISTVFVTVNLLGKVFGTYEFCGVLSLIFELSVNVLQLIIERDRKDVIVINEDKMVRSPKEMYAFWIVGDIAKIWFMVNEFTPFVYLATAFVQLVLDTYLLYN